MKSGFEEDVRRLHAARAAVLRRLQMLSQSHTEIVEASLDTNADDEHDPEGATIAFERSQVSALVSQARARLERIDRALERADDGSYGQCSRCGEPIARARLEARPDATECISCA